MLNKIKPYIMHNKEFIIGALMILALVDNFLAFVIKFVLEGVLVGGLWVIIIAVDYIRDKKVEKPYIKNGIDTRPIIEQLDEVYGGKQCK